MAEGQHLAVVTAAHGHVAGVATLEDVLEYILGQQIVGEHDVHPQMRDMADARLRFHGTATDD